MSRMQLILTVDSEAGTVEFTVTSDGRTVAALDPADLFSTRESEVFRRCVDVVRRLETLSRQQRPG